jgi:hypothetical protein
MSRDALHHSIRWNMKMIALLVRVLSKAYKGLPNVQLFMR